ncbi:HIT family protein [Desemzia sp. RIT804]|nr:HIT family protein [Desemzia sp. RIT 804]
MECLGCDLANKNETVYVVFEDEFVCCILDHAPYNEGHVLILPKEHVRYFDELDENTAKSLTKAAAIISKSIKKLYVPNGITVCQNGCYFNELTHFHMHLIPRYKGQNFADFYLEGNTNYIEDKSNLEETKRKFVNSIKDLNYGG